MPPILAPAVDPTIPSPLPVYVSAGRLTAPTPPPPDPDPGDPDETYAIVAPVEGRRVQVLLRETVTHELVGELLTASVEDYSEDVDLLAPGSAKITASVWDPLWKSVAANTTTGTDGRPVYEWDPKGYEVAIGIDGHTRWVGVFREPIDHGPDDVIIPAREPSILFQERTLGRVEQLDLYEDWGNFERYPVGSTPPNMVIPSGMTARVVADDSVRGGKALEVTGTDWVRCPKVGLLGDAQVGRTAEGSAFGRWPALGSFPADRLTIRTMTQRADALAPSNTEDSRLKAGTRNTDGTDWGADPVASGATMSKSTITHHTWVELKGSTEGVRYDLVRLQQGILTGFLSNTDGVRYPVRVLRDMMARNIGGAPWGFTMRVTAEVGDGGFQMTWNHNGNYSCADVLSACMHRDGGAEAYVNTSWVVVISPRLGTRRTDIRLTPDVCLEAPWAIDPGAEVDDFVAATGRGTGTSAVTSTVSQPFRPFRHRITNIVRAPNDRPLNDVDAWTARHARPAARQQATATVPVPWWLAEKLVKGDIVDVAFEAGNLGLWTKPMRILRMNWSLPDDACDLVLGAEGETESD